MSILPDREPRDCLSTEELWDLVTTSGRPFCLMDVRVVDDNYNDVQPGSRSVGEVVCKGATVFTGYWNLQQANEQAFVDGWFRTGDLAVVRKDGYIQIVDRKKDMVRTALNP